MESFGGFSALLDAFGSFWTLLDAFIRFWRLFRGFWKFLETFETCLMLLDAFGRFETFWTTLDHIVQEDFFYDNNFLVKIVI